MPVIDILRKTKKLDLVKFDEVYRQFIKDPTSPLEFCQLVEN